MPEKQVLHKMEAPIFSDNQLTVVVPNLNDMVFKQNKRSATAIAEHKYDEPFEYDGAHYDKVRLTLQKSDEQYLAEKREKAMDRTWREFATAFKNLTLGQMEEFYNGELRLKLVIGSVAEGSTKAGKKILKETKEGGVCYENLPTIYSQPEDKRVDSKGNPILWTREKVDKAIEDKRGGASSVSRESLLARIKMLEKMLESDKSPTAQEVWAQCLAEAQAHLKRHDNLVKARAASKAKKADEKAADKGGEIPFVSESDKEARRDALLITKEAAELA